MQYDLEARTTQFGKTIIIFVKTLKVTIINQNIISQVLRSATSVGANYREANAASSKKDFRNKIHICRKEIQETEHWLELLAEAESDKKSKIRDLWKEAHELTLIFNKISSSTKNEN
jgi:four helix bundle protein